MYCAYDPSYKAIRVFGTRLMMDLQCRRGECFPIPHVRALLMVFLRRVSYVHHYGVCRPLVVKVALERGVRVCHTYPKKYRARLIGVPRHMSGVAI